MILSSGYPYKLVLISLDWKECSTYAIAYASCFQWGDYFTQLRREKLCHQLRKVKVFQVGIILEEVNFKPKKTILSRHFKLVNLKFELEFMVRTFNNIQNILIIFINFFYLSRRKKNT